MILSSTGNGDLDERFRSENLHFVHVVAKESKSGGNVHLPGGIGKISKLRGDSLGRSNTRQSLNVEKDASCSAVHRLSGPAGQAAIWRRRDDGPSGTEENRGCSRASAERQGQGRRLQVRPKAKEWTAGTH